MKPPVELLTDEIWVSLCETDLIRPAVVAAGRARMASHDWPTPLDVADALLDGQPRLTVSIC